MPATRNSQETAGSYAATALIAFLGLALLMVLCYNAESSDPLQPPSIRAEIPQYTLASNWGNATKNQDRKDSTQNTTIMAALRTANGSIETVPMSISKPKKNILPPSIEQGLLRKQPSSSAQQVP
jgi:hypothetical protein